MSRANWARTSSAFLSIAPSGIGPAALLSTNARPAATTCSGTGVM